MIEALKQVILDMQEMRFPASVPRHLQIQPLPGKATVVIGVRRCGKSTYLHQHIQSLRKAGVQPQQILYLNFFDDRLHGLYHQDPGLILDAWLQLYPDSPERPFYGFFDEIQLLPGWEPFVDRLLRTWNCELYITGSSARLLSKEVATQMRGRALAWELFPFSFAEYLDALGIDHGPRLTSRQRAAVQHAFEAYWQQGGFPEVTGLERSLRIRVHQEYFHATLYRDLVERHDIAHPRAVLDLAHWLMDNCASLYSLNKLTTYLKSLGHRVPKTAVGDYLAWFEDAYFFFTVRLYDTSLKRANANPKKIYCIDHAMIESVASGEHVKVGHRLENLVFTVLRRIFPEIRYYRTQRGHEVDFIATGDDGRRHLVQVCETLGREDTRRRELRALEEAMQELSRPHALVVTRDQEETIETAAGVIQVLPAWRFCLSAERLLEESN